IDSKNTGGTTTGNIWSFTTQVAPPAQVSSPTPANGAPNVVTTTQLSWASATGADSYDVYFAISTTGWTPVTNTTLLTYQPINLSYSTLYYWRIDSRNTGGTTIGNVWSFTTAPAPPAQVTTPSPGNNTTGVSITTSVSWASASGATSYDVYFGTNSPPPKVVSATTNTSYNPGALSYGTPYYWRIDSRNPGGTTQGTVWTFTTCGTVVSGIISENITWTLANSPYIVVGSVLIDSGVTLTIEPGVQVLIASAKSMQVNGTLVARGTTSNKITFTRYSTTEWNYLMFADSSIDAAVDGSNNNYISGSVLEHCIIEYGGGATIDNIGAIMANNAHPFINYCTIRYNKARGISAYNLSAAIRITNNTINNTTGTGVYTNGGTVTISNNNITNNTGSGIYAYNSTVTISNNNITNNTASYGGGICTEHGTITISNNIITNNTASQSGGGIYAYYGTITISNNNITNNTASNGGGIYAYYYSTVSISNNIITNNTASSGSGGGIYTTYGTATISNNTISRNSANNASAVYYSTGGTPNFRYNLISGNQASSSASTIVIIGYPAFNFNNIFGNTSLYELDNANGYAAGSQLNLENNWWGVATSSQIDARIFDWVDNSTKGLSDFSPFASVIRIDTPIAPPATITATGGTGQIALTWTANTESDLAGYRVHWGTAPGVYTNSVNVGNVTNYTITPLSAGTYYVTVTAYDASIGTDDPATITNENQTAGNESWYAPELSRVVN
ncbi:MAG: right-handed parallel beta-helix repeat-containing protein, partial [Planctomycetota bacterium]|nr:right-handed parallel beta-helix repeat-containing protein [Planctomycetota bacterium]